MILDTDMGTDVDDALALAFALRHPDIELVAVTTVADDVVRRAQIAQKLLRIAGRDDIEVAPGVGWTAPPASRRSWGGHEGVGFLDADDEARTFERDGVALLLEETREGDIEIATVGMQSNVAAAVERDPSLSERVARLDVMGGAFAPIIVGGVERPPAFDHNLIVDPDASLRSLNAGFEVMYTPIDVTVQVPLRMSHLEGLGEGDELCRALVPMLEAWRNHANYPDDTAALLHDPLAVACAVDRAFVTVERLPVTVAMHDGAVRTFIDPVQGREADVVTSVDAKPFADFWLETVLRPA